ncbi:MAG: very short patch repair endonuclease [Muribaculaceae bacterium]|nr:very short patch repair endonuclease [Muribaculaceae bacterium]
MTDVMTPEERSRCMAAIKGRDTKPEMLVRKYLFARGLRYRVNNRKLPGSPDIVLKKYKTVVFIDGCFWHGHKGCKYYRLPQSNTDYWRKKITGNAARDYVNNVDLQLAGWKVIRIWECQLKTKEQREQTLERLYQTITGPRRKPIPYTDTPDEIQIAAEPDLPMHNA